MAGFAAGSEQSVQFLARQPDGSDLLASAPVTAEHLIPTSDPQWPSAFASAIAVAQINQPGGQTLFLLPGSVGSSEFQGEHYCVVAPVRATTRIPAGTVSMNPAVVQPAAVAEPERASRLRGYRSAVRAIVRRLGTDGLSQVVFTSWHPCPTTPTSERWLAHMWANSPDARYAYRLRLSGVDMIGRCSLDYLDIVDGVLRCGVLAGTAPLGQAHTAKEHVEHRGLVDARVADLSRCGLDAAVAESAVAQVVGHNRYLRSLITAGAELDGRIGRLLIACWPGAAVSGAPSKPARRLADEYEEMPRGYFGGVIGVLDWQAGRLSSASTVTCVLSSGRLRYAPVATGITAGSTPAGEEREQSYKLRNIMGGIPA
jgi:anthranilate/para-aminobenzoate synthase component I